VAATVCGEGKVRLFRRVVANGDIEYLLGDSRTPNQSERVVFKSDPFKVHKTVRDAQGSWKETVGTVRLAEMRKVNPVDLKSILRGSDISEGMNSKSYASKKVESILTCQCVSPTDRRPGHQLQTSKFLYVSRRLNFTPRI
jgi:hypothetical protein